MAIQSNFPAIRPSLLLDFANSKRLDPRITFTRASTARFYDGSTVAKAEENLFQQSQGFNETAWGKTNSTVTANTTTAPDGTSTADTFTPNATTAFFRVNQTATFAGPITVSAFVKANGYSKVAIREDNATGSAATFDLSTGAVIGVVNSGAVTVSNNTITALADSWYRISCTFTGTGSLSGAFLILNPSYTSGSVTATWAANGTSGIFIWGAQLEQRSAVTAYTATTTAPITNYVPQLQTAQNNVPRFDHNPTTGESLGLLIEEQRTNLLQRSEEFDNAYWNKVNATITANAVVGPDGTLTADKLVEDATTNAHLVARTSGILPIGTNTVSVYVKAGERSRIGVGNSSSGQYATFNLATGAVISSGTGTVSGGTITAVGNGWYRCACIVTLTGTASFGIILIDDSNNTSYAGDGYKGAYIWGAQVEVGAFATSYIPTTAASATRQADAASMTGTNFSSWFNNAEGTLYREVSTFSETAGAHAFIGAGTANYLQFGQSTAAINYLLYTEYNDAVVASLTEATSNYPANTFNRFASAYKVNDFAASGNGRAVVTDTSGNVPTVNALQIGNFNGTSFLNGAIRKLAFYPARLTNAQLQAITG